MEMDQRFEQLERQTKRLRITVVVLAAALCGVVSMAATENADGHFDAVFAKKIFVSNDKGNMAVSLISGGDGGGIAAFGPTGKKLVMLSTTLGGHGAIKTYSQSGKELVVLGAVNGNGEISTYKSSGNPLVELGISGKDNGMVRTLGSSGKEIVSLGSTHLLRHSFALAYIENGGDTFTLQRILGHTETNVKAQHSKYSPGERL